MKYTDEQIELMAEQLIEVFTNANADDGIVDAKELAIEEVADFSAEEVVSEYKYYINKI